MVPVKNGAEQNQNTEQLWANKSSGFTSA